MCRICVGANFSFKSMWAQHYVTNIRGLVNLISYTFMEIVWWTLCNGVDSHDTIVTDKYICNKKLLHNFLAIFIPRIEM